MLKNRRYNLVKQSNLNVKEKSKFTHMNFGGSKQAAKFESAVKQPILHNAGYIQVE